MQLELENSNVKCEDDRISFSEETLFQQLQHIKHQLMQNCKSSFQRHKLKGIHVGFKLCLLSSYIIILIYLNHNFLQKFFVTD